MKWASAFKYLPTNYNDRIASVTNLTQWVCFDNNLNGSRIRLHFSNTYAKQPLAIDAVTAGFENGDCVTDTTPVTLGGKSSFVLDPGQEVFSDEIDFSAQAGKRLAVNLYIRSAQDVESICCFWSRANASVAFGKGDSTKGESLDEATPDQILPLIKDDPSSYKTIFFYGFDALQVYTDDDVKVISAFGDSITHMSFVTNAITRRLYSDYPGKVTLINSGIGGNRLVHDATFVKEIGQVIPVFGEAGIRRFEKDVFGLDKVDTVLALIGINDIMHPIQLEGLSDTTSPEEIIEGYRTIASIAHRHGTKIFGATVMPCGNTEFPQEWIAAFEKTRRVLNDWIHQGNDYDGFFDYEAVMKDENNPGYLLPDVHIGDGLHPNDQGGEIIARMIDMAKLTGIKEAELRQLKHAEIPVDITAQVMAFDPVLPQEGIPDVLVQDDEGAYWLQIAAPDAKTVQNQINLDIYNFHQDLDGIWRVKLQLSGGLHYIQLLVDGTLWLSPYLPIAYGYSRPCNVIALPEPEEDFYRLKDVPHGKLIRDYFFSSVTGNWESCMIYTPPGYEEEPEAVYSVLYLQHGHGENETAWSGSGKLPFILDNLIAAGKCAPFAVVMNNGMVQKEVDSRRIVDFMLFGRYLTEDVIPFAEGRYRIGGCRAKRAMAGLSMGSLQTSMTGFAHPDLFSSLGIFSGFLHDWISGSELDMVQRGPGDDRHLTFLNDKEKFDTAFDVFFRAIGDEDPFLPYFEADDERCEKAGIQQDRRIYHGSHDWNVWRKCIRDFAQLIFKEA